jgi:4-aminobutyrate aminotransferase/(S)-3-amino-2-methylpropionate transaminase
VLPVWLFSTSWNQKTFLPAPTSLVIKSERVEAFKETFSIVGDVRGLSGMMAMELVLDKETKAPAPELANALKTFCFEKGLMLLATGTYGNVIRILSPLVITDDQLEQGLNIMEQGFAAIGK